MEGFKKNSSGYCWVSRDDIVNSTKYEVPDLNYLQPCPNSVKSRIHMALATMLTEPKIENALVDMFNEEMNKLTCNAFGDYKTNRWSIHFYDEPSVNKYAPPIKRSIVKFKNDKYIFVLDDYIELNSLASSTASLNISYIRIGVIVSDKIVMSILQ